MENRRLKFSIIIPIYNAEKYLRTCVNSVIKQTYSNLEIILIDDGSIDKCPTICDEYKKSDNRIVVIHKKNEGVVSARKIGSKIATGDYVVCIDADDYIQKTYIEDFAVFLLRNKTDVVCCGYTKINSKKIKEIPIVSSEKTFDKNRIENDIFPSLIKNKKSSYFSYSLWAKAYKRVLYQECQSQEDNNIKIGEDAICVIAMLYRAKSLGMISSCGYFYRINSFSVTNSKKSFPLNNPKLEYNYLKSMIDFNIFDFNEQLYRFIVHSYFTVIVSQFYRKEEFNLIKNDIEFYLKDELYLRAIMNAKFSGSWKASLMMYALKNNKFRLVKLWAIFKQ